MLLGMFTLETSYHHEEPTFGPTRCLYLGHYLGLAPQSDPINISFSSLHNRRRHLFILLPASFTFTSLLAYNADLRMLKRTCILAYRRYKKSKIPKTVPHPMLVPGRKHLGKPARFSSPNTPFCYTEHNRICASGENGTFMYRVPEMFALEQDKELLHMNFVTVVDLLRMITQSNGIMMSWVELGWVACGNLAPI